MDWAQAKYINSQADGPFKWPLPTLSCPSDTFAISRARALSVNYDKEGQHEKNVNQRNPGRGVANGDGRWPAPVRSEYRITRQRT